MCVYVYMCILFTSSSLSLANFLSCILNPTLGFAISLQNLTTASDSSMPSVDTHITYSVVIVTAREIPAALRRERPSYVYLILYKEWFGGVQPSC